MTTPNLEPGIVFFGDPKCPGRGPWVVMPDGRWRLLKHPPFEGQGVTPRPEHKVVEILGRLPPDRLEATEWRDEYKLPKGYRPDQDDLRWRVDPAGWRCGWERIPGVTSEEKAHPVHPSGPKPSDNHHLELVDGRFTWVGNDLPKSYLPGDTHQLPGSESAKPIPAIHHGEWKGFQIRQLPNGRWSASKPKSTTSFATGADSLPELLDALWCQVERDKAAAAFEQVRKDWETVASSPIIAPGNWWEATTECVIHNGITWYRDPALDMKERNRHFGRSAYSTKAPSIVFAVIYPTPTYPSTTLVVRRQMDPDKRQLYDFPTVEAAFTYAEDWITKRFSMTPEQVREETAEFDALCSHYSKEWVMECKRQRQAFLRRREV